jgi:tetratricopeptide (TPR) repeat protein
LVVAASMLVAWRRAALPLVLEIGICFLHSFFVIDWDYIAVQGPLFLTVGALAAGPPRARRGWLPAAAVGLCALAAVYSLASPWLSQHRYNTALDSVTNLNLIGARDEAQSAHSFNPLALEPIWLLAALTVDKAEALALYKQARDLEPENPEAWYELGVFELKSLKQPRAAYRDLNHAYTLDSFLFGKGTQPGRDLDRARCEVDPATCR